VDELRDRVGVAEPSKRPGRRDGLGRTPAGERPAKVGDEGLFDAFATTIEEIGDDRLRVFLYLIPQMSGIEIGVDLIERLHAAFPKTIAGLKDSSGSWPATEVLCRRLGGKIDVMVGTESLMLRAMAAGASGCITAMGNVGASAIVKLFEQREDPGAQILERAINARRTAFERYPIVPALKAYLAQASGVESWRTVRPPLRTLSPEDVGRLHALLA